MATNDIADQIASSADFYEPSATYTERLRFDSTVEFINDTVDGEFISLTGARKNPALFAIGLIAPAVDIDLTRGLIDRSSTLKAKGINSEAIVGQREANKDVEKLLNIKKGITGNGDDDFRKQSALARLARRTEKPNGPKQSSDQDFWVQYVVMCNRLGIQADQLGLVINSESGFSATAENPKSGTVGLIQFTKSTLVGLYVRQGMTKEQAQEAANNVKNLSATQQLSLVEQYYKSSKVAGATALYLKGKAFGDAYLATNGNGSFYDRDAGQKGYSQPAKQKLAYDLNSGLDRDGKGYITVSDLQADLDKSLLGDKLNRIDEARGKLGMSERGYTYKVDSAGQEPTSGQVDLDEILWRRLGYKAAQDYDTNLANLSKYNLNETSDLGRALQSAQLRERTYLYGQIEAMRSRPPLRMLINPSEFEVEFQKQAPEDAFTRNGSMVQFFAEQQPVIQGSGLVAAFYAHDVRNPTAPGINRTARQYSKSYKNFMSLYALYRNNGAIYGRDREYESSGGYNRLALVGSAYLYYDNVMYVGSFHEFDITEDVSTPFSLRYRFTFNVRAFYRLNKTASQKLAENASTVVTKNASQQTLPRDPQNNINLP